MENENNIKEQDLEQVSGGKNTDDLDSYPTFLYCPICRREHDVVPDSLQGHSYDEERHEFGKIYLCKEKRCTFLYFRSDGSTKRWFKEDDYY